MIYNPNISVNSYRSRNTHDQYPKNSLEDLTTKNMKRRVVILAKNTSGQPDLPSCQIISENFKGQRSYRTCMFLPSNLTKEDVQKHVTQKKSSHSCMSQAPSPPPMDLIHNPIKHYQNIS